jgi:nucleoside-diphosphate-sugar epimerase
MQIGITGGTGFIGRHLARVPTAQGHQVSLLARSLDQGDRSRFDLPHTSFTTAALDDGRFRL